MQPVRFRPFALRLVRGPDGCVAGRGSHGRRGPRAHRRSPAAIHLRGRATGRSHPVLMRFVTTRALRPTVPSGADADRQSPSVNGVSLRTAMLEGLAPDGGLYVPETIDCWQQGELARLRNRTLTEIAYRALRPYTRPELDATTFEAVVVAALNFPIPLVEVEPHIYALELFHGPTLAFKDVGARTMARLLASLDTGDQPLTVLAATSGDTGSAVAHAFHAVPHTRVVVLYPE